MLSLAAVRFAPAQSPLDDGYRQMYNLDFQDAHRIFADYQRRHPADPMGPVSEAAAHLFGEFDRLDVLRSEFALKDENFLTAKPLKADPNAKRLFEAALARTAQLVNAAQTVDAHTMLASVLRLGLHADYLALIEKRNLAALSEIKQARQLADKLLLAHPNLFDAYIAVGTENYLLSLKPAPVRWVLSATGAQTDKRTGLEKLKLTEEKGRFLAPFARLLLAVAALRDKDVEGARQRLAALAREFPRNRLYVEELQKLKLK